MKYWYSAFFLLALSFSAFSQTPSPYVSVTVTAKSGEFDGTRNAWWGPIAGNWRWRFYNSYGHQCGYANSLGQVWNDFPSGGIRTVTNLSTNVNDGFVTDVEAWQENSYYQCDWTSSCGQGNCDYNSGGCGCGDDTHYPRQYGDQNLITIHPIDFPPGNVNTNLVDIEYFLPGSTTVGYVVKYLVNYNPPAPSFTINHGSTAYANEQLCDTEVITLIPTSSVDKYKTQLRYEWEYNVNGETYTHWYPNPAYCGDIPGYCGGTGGTPPVMQSFNSKQLNQNGTLLPLSIPPPDTGPAPCCFEPPELSEELTYWRSLGTSYGNDANGGDFSFQVKNILASISQNATIYIRARITSNGASGGYSGSKIIKVSPLPPTMSQLPITQASCPISPSGKIFVTGVKSPYGDFRYLIKPGYPASACDPNLANCLDKANYSGVVTSDEAITKTDTIYFHGTPVVTTTTFYQFEQGGVTPGTYSLFLTNNGSNKGVCLSAPVRVDVGLVPDLAVSTPNNFNLTCYNDTHDVAFTISNGGPSALPDKNVNYKFYNGVGTLISDTNTSIDGATVTYTSLAADSYKLVVDDACTSPVTRNYQIIAPIKVNMADTDFSVAAATCNIPGNGEISTTVTNSKSSSINYDFRILASDGSTVKEIRQSSAKWTPGGLSVGDNYQLVVTEDGSPLCNGVTQNFNIAPSIMDIIVDNVSPALCYHESSGQIRLHGTGGSGNFDYQIKDQAGSSILDDTSDNGYFAGLAAGNYELTTLNALLGCTDSFTSSVKVTVFEPTALNVNFSKTDVSCFNKGDGKITATPGGGTPGVNNSYIYSWEANFSSGYSYLGATDSTVQNLQPASYRVNITDANGCLLTSPEVKITEPDELIISSVRVNDIACLGDKGTIAVRANGGTQAYNYAYAINGGQTFASFDSLAQLPAADYIVKVVDAHGCATTDENTYKITDPPSVLDFSFTQNWYGDYNISCYGGNNGEVTISATGGNGGNYSGYQFAWEGGAFSTNNTVTGIIAGDKKIKVQDARGCVVSKTATFTQAPQIVTLTSAKKDVDCFGASTGTIQLSTTGGTGSFLYQLGTLSNNTGFFQDLAAADYSITITDDNKCSVIYPETIVNLYPALSATPAIQNVKCFNGNDGEIALSMSGGVAPYQFQIGSDQISNPLTGVAAGTYDINVMDSKGCLLAVNSIPVAQPDLLVINGVTMNDIVCIGGSGFLDVASAGGTTPYIYEYSTDGGTTYASFTNSTPLNAASYSVRTRDTNGCIASNSQNYIITNPPSAVDFTFTKSDYSGFNISCYGGSNGFAILSPTGGNGFTYSGYQFALDGGVYQTDPKLVNINAGDHSLSVKDARGCVVSQVGNFTQSSVAIAATVVRTKDVVCFNDKTGEIEVTIVGGAAPYQYQIISQPYQGNNVFTNLAVGTYAIQVIDNNSCPAQTSGSIASINPAIVLSGNITDVSCFGGNDGVIDVTASGGVPQFAFQWMNLNVNTATASQLQQGDYTVKVTDNAGCFVQEKYSVGQPATALNASLTSDPACWGQENGGIHVEPNGGTSPYQYSLDGGTFDIQSNFSTGAGIHKVSVKDLKGCSYENSISVAQKIDKPDYNFLAASTDYALDTVVVTDVSVPKPDSVQWAFDPNATIIKNDQWSPQILFAIEGTYWIEMKSFFSGCSYTLHKNIVLKPYDPSSRPSSSNGYKTISSFDVSPNPSSGDFNIAIKLSIKSDVVITVYNMLGITMFSYTWPSSSEVQQKISLPNVPTGIYLVRATAETDAKETRLVINK